MGDARFPAGAWRTILWIMLGIMVWGVFHAIGAWRLNHDIRRLLVVLGCVAAFLAFWGGLLAAKWRMLDGKRLQGGQFEDRQPEDTQPEIRG